MVEGLPRSLFLQALAEIISKKAGISALVAVLMIKLPEHYGGQQLKNCNHKLQTLAKTVTWEMNNVKQFDGTEMAA